MPDVWTPIGDAMKPKYEPGEYLDLRWDYGDPEEVYVYGHVDTPSFLRSVASYHSGSIESLDFGTFPVLSGEIRHRWARFVFAGSSLEGTCRELREYREAGPGRFRITAMTPDKWIRFPQCARTVAGKDGESSCWIREGHSGPCVPWSPRG
jgi:hypothetical protein